MDIFDALLLGIIQGITEFLPISSSGHLVVVREVLGYTLEGSLFFDVMLHVATLLVILIYFHKRIFGLIVSFGKILVRHEAPQEDKMIIAGVIVGTAPAVLVGLLYGDLIEDTFRNAWWVVVALVVGGCVFLLAERVAKQTEQLTIGRGFLIGLFQVLAFIPGTSRSGITIAGGLFSGMTREKAAEFSFFMAMPVIAGAAVTQVMASGVGAITTPIIAGMVGAFVFGLIAIHFLMKFVKSHRLDVFVWYRFILAGIVALFLLIF